MVGSTEETKDGSADKSGDVVALDKAEGAEVDEGAKLDEGAVVD